MSALDIRAPKQCCLSRLGRIIFHPRRSAASWTPLYFFQLCVLDSFSAVFVQSASKVFKPQVLGNSWLFPQPVVCIYNLYEHSGIWFCWPRPQMAIKSDLKVCNLLMLTCKVYLCVATLGLKRSALNRQIEAASVRQTKLSRYPSKTCREKDLA